MRKMSIIFTVVILGFISACAQNATNTTDEIEFIEAAKNNDTEKLQSLLKKGVDI